MPVAWITGGARRLGRAIAVNLAQQGFDVCLTYNQSSAEASVTAAEISAIGRTVEFEQCDVTDVGQLQDVMDRFLSKLSVPDVIVSNAGIFPGPHPIHQLTETDMVDAFRTNTVPLVTIARKYWDVCTQQSVHGRIVVMGSLGASEIWNNRTAYNASKAALHTTARSLARSLAPHISVNIVAPGAIEQPAEITSNDATMVNSNRIPMQRYGTSADVAQAVLFFATCTPFITGQTIGVDGGSTLSR